MPSFAPVASIPIASGPTSVYVPPAPADGDPAFYEIFGESLGVFNGYRTEFLGP